MIQLFFNRLHNYLNILWDISQNLSENFALHVFLTEELSVSVH
jgi:hypothetical protein